MSNPQYMDMVIQAVEGGVGVPGFTVTITHPTNGTNITETANINSSDITIPVLSSTTEYSVSVKCPLFKRGELKVLHTNPDRYIIVLKKYDRSEYCELTATLKDLTTDAVIKGRAYMQPSDNLNTSPILVPSPIGDIINILKNINTTITFEAPGYYGLSTYHNPGNKSTDTKTVKLLKKT